MLKFLIEPGYDVKAPQREAGNAGVDFFIPNYNSFFEDAFNLKNDRKKATLDFVKKQIVIKPHCDANIPSGIHSFMDKDTGLLALNKSGIASKKKLIVGACLVDPNYQGIIHCHVINTSDEEVAVDLGTKLVQFVPYKFDTTEIVVESNMSQEDFYADLEFSNRGAGGFGSTGLK